MPPAAAGLAHERVRSPLLATQRESLAARGHSARALEEELYNVARPRALGPFFYIAFDRYETSDRVPEVLTRYASAPSRMEIQG